MYWDFQQETKGSLKVGKREEDLILRAQGVRKIWRLAQYCSPEGARVQRGHTESHTMCRETSDKKNHDLQKRDSGRRQRRNQGEECFYFTFLFAHWLNPNKSQKAG